MGFTFRTTAMVQIQLGDSDVTHMRTNDERTRVVLYATPHEVILERATLERALQFLTNKTTGDSYHASHVTHPDPSAPAEPDPEDPAATAVG